MPLSRSLALGKGWLEAGSNEDRSFDRSKIGCSIRIGSKCFAGLSDNRNLAGPKRCGLVCVVVELVTLLIPSSQSPANLAGQSMPVRGDRTGVPL